MRPASFALVGLFALGCASRPPEHVVGTPAGRLAVQSVYAEDSTPKAELRMVPPEVYMRTYLQLFGGLAPVDAQEAARGPDGNQLFDKWDLYVSALGFPDYGLDIPRQTQTNALMVATFERLGIALCDRAVLHDLAMLDLAKPKPKNAPAPKPEKADKPEKPHKPEKPGKPEKPEKPAPPPSAPAVSEIIPVNQRVIFAFEPKTGTMDQADFEARFDVLHRTFLGYPAALAPPERSPRFFALYNDVAAHHGEALPKSKLSPAQAGWAAVCYGLVRHPEFHLY